jgi:hypothetical protein
MRTVYRARWNGCSRSQTIKSCLGGIGGAPPSPPLPPAVAASETETIEVVAFSRRRKYGLSVSRSEAARSLLARVLWSSASFSCKLVLALKTCAAKQVCLPTDEASNAPPLM